MYGLTPRQARDIGSAIRRGPNGFKPQLLGGKGGWDIVMVSSSVTFEDTGTTPLNQTIDVPVQTVLYPNTLAGMFGSNGTRTFHKVDIPLNMMFVSDGSRLLFPLRPTEYGTVTTEITNTGRGVVSIGMVGIGNASHATNISRVQSILMGNGTIPVGSVVELQLRVYADHARWNVVGVKCSAITVDELYSSGTDSGSSSDSEGDASSGETGSSS